MGIGSGRSGGGGGGGVKHAPPARPSQAPWYLVYNHLVLFNGEKRCQHINCRIRRHCPSYTGDNIWPPRIPFQMFTARNW